MFDATALIADDDACIREALSVVLEDLGFNILSASTAAEAIEIATSEQPDVVLLDLRFPDSSDLVPLKTIRQKCPDTDVLLVTSQTADYEKVVEAVQLGAFDYVPKPVREDDLRIRLVRVMEMRKLQRTHERVVQQFARGHEIADVVGESGAIRVLVDEVKRVAPYDMPVLILGETGTGKELVARALHNSSPRRSNPFISVNCAALPETLTESELFGHERGAFTGAVGSRAGAFEEAEDGTIFLDEIGDMSLQAQAVLLHVLETGRYRSVGGREKTTQARVVLATNQDLDRLVEEHLFRQDLLFRINRIRLRTPPLREHPEDIPLLALRFLQEIDSKVGKGVREIETNALTMLSRHSWPGNVRELKNEVERAYIYAARPTLTAMDLSPELLVGPAEEDLGSRMSEEIRSTLEALRATDGNMTRAAKLLNVHRNTIRNRMKLFLLHGGE